MQHESYLVVVPARGGSKGIPHKNIASLGGKPLIEYTLDVFASFAGTMDIAVSTDCREIAEVASRYSFVHMIHRPHSISTDESSTEDALLDAIDQMKDQHNKEYTSVITAQPTSPFRTTSMICNFLKQYEDSRPQFDALLTLTETRSDYWVESNTGFMRLNPNAPRRRQDRKPLYVENSCLYVTDITSLRITHSVLGTRCNGFIIEDREALDINVPYDLEYAHFILENDFESDSINFTPPFAIPSS